LRWPRQAGRKRLAWSHRLFIGSCAWGSSTFRRLLQGNCRGLAFCLCDLLTQTQPYHIFRSSRHIAKKVVEADEDVNRGVRLFLWRWVDRPRVFEEHSQLPIGLEDVLAKHGDESSLASALFQELLHSIVEVVFGISLLDFNELWRIEKHSLHQTTTRRATSMSGVVRKLLRSLLCARR
jgi:hypothetical protein